MKSSQNTRLDGFIRYTAWETRIDRWIDCVNERVGLTTQTGEQHWLFGNWKANHRQRFRGLLHLAGHPFLLSPVLKRNSIKNFRNEVGVLSVFKTILPNERSFPSCPIWVRFRLKALWNLLTLLQEFAITRCRLAVVPSWLFGKLHFLETAIQHSISQQTSALQKQVKCGCSSRVVSVFFF